MHVHTRTSEQVWQSSDGQRTIWQVTLRADDGKDYNLKTYSTKIAELGFDGEVRSYVNPRGERFVRQIPTVPNATDLDGKPMRPKSPLSESTIRAQWAIGQAINLASVKMDKEAITLPVIEKYAKELYATVSRVKGEELTPEQETEGENYIKRFTDGPGLF
jgi:hypothetical protein